MSSGKKRYDSSEGSKSGRKRPRLDPSDSPHSEREISVHIHPDPYEDDFDLRGESDTESPEKEENSPNVTLEPGLDIQIDSPAFPLSKVSQGSSKHGRRHYRGGIDAPRDVPHLTKSATLPVMESRRSKDRFSRSRSKSPYMSEQGVKSRIVKRNASSGKNSPAQSFEPDSRLSEQYRGVESRERPRSKHVRSEHRSRHPEYRDHDSRRGSREVRLTPRDQDASDSRSRSKEYRSHSSIDSGSRKDKGYSRAEDRVRSSFKRHREEERYVSSRRLREEHHERPSRESSRRKRKHHRHSPHLSERKELRVIPAVLEGGSGDESSEVKPLTDDIEDLIKDIEESSSSSSSEEEMGETKEGSVQSPVTVSSRSSSSRGEMRTSPGSLGEENEEQSGDRDSGSEGEIHSPVPSDPYVMPRSRFDTSDHSDSDEDTNLGPSQQGRGQYVEVMSEEGSGASAVNSPEPPAEIEDPPSPHESPEPPPLPPLPPYLPALMGCKNVESYEWLDRIEEGTYGVVYKAKDKRTGDIVALKKLKMEKEKEGFPITSLREINMLLKAAHPNIVPVREIVVGSNMDKIYIVMDFIKHDLKALMSTMKEKFLEGEVKTMMIHLLRAVHHMHDNWILHRDLKTSNLLLSHDNILKVADFGLAREYGSPLLHYTPVVVTLWYRSPELLLGVKEYSTAVDIWSVGCIFAELLLHKPLFQGRSEIDQLNKIFTELGTPNEKIWPGFKQLSGAKNVTFTHHPQGNLRKKHPSLTTQTGFDLLFKLLTYDPKTRITAKDALDHQYFKDNPRPVPPEMFPTWPTKSEIAKSKQKREKSPTPPEGGAFVLKADQLSPGPGFSLKF